MARKKHKAKKHPHAHLPDQHPHFAGHRTAGYAVGEAHHANTSPRPGQVEFNAPQEQAMRNSGAPAAPGGEPDADDMPGAPQGGNDMDADDSV